jgi:hypothetical protein
LLLDVLFQDRKRCPTTRNDTIRAGAEDGLAIDPLESELLAEQPGTRRFEIVPEPGQIEVGRQRNQQVDVIGLAIEFEQAPTPPGATRRGNLANSGKHRRLNALSPIFVAAVSLLRRRAISTRARTSCAGGYLEPDLTFDIRAN